MLLDPADPATQPPVRERPEVRLLGQMDMATVDEMLAPAFQLVDAGQRHVLLRCSDLDFCDSQGLKGLIALLIAVQPDGSVTLLDASDMLLELLRLTALADRFTIISSDEHCGSGSAAAGASGAGGLPAGRSSSPGVGDDR